MNLTLGNTFVALNFAKKLEEFQFLKNKIKLENWPLKYTSKSS